MNKLDELAIEELDYVKECVTVDEDEVNSEFARLPTDLAYWNKLYSRAVRDEMATKLNYKKVYAERSQVLREELKESGKVTEAMLESAVQMDVAYQQAYLKHIDAVERKTEIFGWIDAIKSKKDALVTLGANIRAERKEPSINKEEDSWIK